MAMAADLSNFVRFLDDAIEALIAVRDIISRDPDLEDDDPAEDADPAEDGDVSEDDDPAEDGGDAEPILGWTVNGDMGATFDPDRELDPAEMGEPEVGL